MAIKKKSSSRGSIRNLVKKSSPEDVPKLFVYHLGPSGERLDVKEIPYEEVKDEVRDGDYLVFAKSERRYYLKEELEISGKWTEVPASQITDKQETVT